MRSALVFALLVCGMVGCSESAEQKAARAEEEANLSLRVDAELAVERQLRDPSSAEFEEVAVYKDAEGAKRVCGFVNAANAFGGMAGRRPFIAGNGTATIGDSENAKEFRLAWEQACRLRQEG